MKEFITCSLALSLAFLSTLSAKAVDGKNPAERLFQQWDKNNDGVLEKQEVPPGPRRMFDKKDANNDGKITLAEHLGKSMRPPRQSNAKATFTIHQTWNQQPDGYDRPVYVAEPAAKTEKAPVIIYFHEESNVTFIEVTGGSHGLAPHREAAIAYIREFLER